MRHMNTAIFTHRHQGNSQGARSHVDRRRGRRGRHHRARVRIYDLSKPPNKAATFCLGLATGDALAAAGTAAWAGS